MDRPRHRRDRHGTRWYRTGTGTFTSRDPHPLDARDVANADRHTYANADPLTNTDHTGRSVGPNRHDGGGLYMGLVRVASSAEDLYACHRSCGTTIPGKPKPVPNYGAYSADVAGRYDRIGSPSTSGRISSGDAEPGSAKSGARSSNRGPGGRTSGPSGAASTWYDARAASVTANALRPAPRPPATVTIAAHIQAMIDAANNTEGIDLGVLHSDGGLGRLPFDPARAAAGTGMTAPLTCGESGRAPPQPAAVSPDFVGGSSCLIFYSVQSAEDADRLINRDGSPWPDGTDKYGRPRTEHGPGLYSWDNVEAAEKYLNRLSTRENAPRDLFILEHKISVGDFNRLSHADMDAMSEEAATDLWLSAGEGYDHIQRATGNFGVEHYFHKDIYWLFSSSRR